MDPSLPVNLDEYSSSSTTIKFDHQLPLLRGPMPAAQPDDPSSGPYVLAFRNPQSWAAAYKLCHSKIISQCEGGARVGCAISASEKCKPPWWRNLIGKNLPDLNEREICEERETEGCLIAAKERCAGFAKDKCFRPFNDARIAVGKGIAGREKFARKLLCIVSMPKRSNELIRLIGFNQPEFEITNLRANELLASDSNYDWFFKS